jgi:hypothetical protein
LVHSDADPCWRPHISGWYYRVIPPYLCVGAIRRHAEQLAQVLSAPLAANAGTLSAVAHFPFRPFTPRPLRLEQPCAMPSLVPAVCRPYSTLCEDMRIWFHVPTCAKRCMRLLPEPPAKPVAIDGMLGVTLPSTKGRFTSGFGVPTRCRWLCWPLPTPHLRRPPSSPRRMDGGVPFGALPSNRRPRFSASGSA